MHKSLINSIIKINKNLFIIELNPPLVGFKRFLSSWLYKCYDFNALIDVGPYVTVSQLLDALTYLEVEHLDYIFLTHVHLDHSGAIAKVLDSFKNTTVICHKRGIPLLINPKRLWESSLRTLDRVARVYGKPSPINESILFISELPKGNPHDIKVINITGHSSHHISILIEDYMFLGEAAGVLFKLPYRNVYMRPATPPPFFVDKYLSSLHKIIEIKPKLICYAHLDVINNKKYGILEQHFTQIQLWVSTINESILVNGIHDQIKLINDCLKRLLENDPFLSPIKYMSKEARKREFFFIKNSIKGFIYSILKI